MSDTHGLRLNCVKVRECKSHTVDRAGKFCMKCMRFNFADLGYKQDHSHIVLKYESKFSSIHLTTHAMIAACRNVKTCYLMVGVNCLSRLNVNMCEKRTVVHYGKYDWNVSKEKKTAPVSLEHQGQTLHSSFDRLTNNDGC